MAHCRAGDHGEIGANGRERRVVQPDRAQHRVAAAPVLGLEAHATYLHFRARGMLTAIRHPKAGEFSLYISPIKLFATPGRIERAAPCFGEDNERVFEGLHGLKPQEHRDLQAHGVVR